MADLNALEIVVLENLRGANIALRQGPRVFVPPEVWSLMKDGGKSLALICKHLMVINVPVVSDVTAYRPPPAFPEPTDVY